MKPHWTALETSTGDPTGVLTEDRATVSGGVQAVVRMTMENRLLAEKQKED